MRYGLDSYFEPVEMDRSPPIVVASTPMARTVFDRQAGDWVTSPWRVRSGIKIRSRSWLEACLIHHKEDPRADGRFSGEVLLAHALTTNTENDASRWMNSVPDSVCQYFAASMSLGDAHLANRVAFVRHGILAAMEYPEATSQESIDTHSRWVATGSIAAIIRGINHKTMIRNIIEIGDVTLCAYVQCLICARFGTPGLVRDIVRNKRPLTIYEGEEE